MAEKKVEVEINGKILRVPEHLVNDMAKFGATLTKRTIKNPPKELLNMPEPRKVVLPPVEPPKLDLPDPYPAEPVAEVIVVKNKGGRPKKK
jgi:hypothetical protein